MRTTLIQCCAVAFLFTVALPNVNAAEKKDTRHYQNTIEQLQVMHTGEVSVGPSATYWSEREMPLYIQNGCTENPYKEKQACPF